MKTTKEMVAELPQEVQELWWQQQANCATVFFGGDESMHLGVVGEVIANLIHRGHTEFKLQLVHRTLMAIGQPQPAEGTPELEAWEHAQLRELLQSSIAAYVNDQLLDEGLQDKLGALFLEGYATFLREAIVKVGKKEKLQ